MTPARAFLGIAVCLTGLAMSGCSSSDGAVQPSSVTTPTAASQYKLPLLAYMSEENELALTQQAAFRQQTRCAARFGVETEPQEVDRAGIRAQINIERRYGLVDREEVAQYGYDYPPDATGQEKDSGPISAHQASVDEVMSGQTSEGPSAMTDNEGKGLPDGGCGAEGWTVIRGGVAYDYDRLPIELLDEARQKFEQDQGYKDAERDWAACMKKSGYTFTHRHEAGNSVREESEPRQREMALLDVDCAHEVNYVGRVMAIDAAYQERLIADHEGDLRGVLESKSQLMERVKKALS